MAKNRKRPYVLLGLGSQPCKIISMKYRPDDHLVIESSVPSCGVVGPFRTYLEAQQFVELDNYTKDLYIGVL
jgi:hypothetical protein